MHSHIVNKNCILENREKEKECVVYEKWQRTKRTPLVNVI